MAEEKERKKGFFKRLFKKEDESEAQAPSEELTDPREMEAPVEVTTEPPRGSAPQESSPAEAEEADDDFLLDDLEELPPEAPPEASLSEHTVAAAEVPVTDAAVESASLEQAAEVVAEEEDEDDIDDWFIDDIEEEPAVAVKPLQEASTPQVVEPEQQKGFFKLFRGLSKTRKGLIESLDETLLGKKELDSDMIAKLEQILVTSDVGVRTSFELLQSLQERVARKDVDDPRALIGHLKNRVEQILEEVESPMRVGFGPEPFVVLVVGVNGSGKTTTIAKIAARHKMAGGTVLLAAGDTFRAAAVEQLQIWGDRIGVPVVKGRDKADPSSVAYEAMERALNEGTHLVLIDTAGRLHTRVPLMDQLKKVRRTIEKKMPSAPHETLLVIDSSMGQNAIHQAKSFSEALPVTGIAMTKLDGTAKGGVIVGISHELKIPVRYIGVGEKMHDLRDFRAKDFAAALFSVEEGSTG